MLPQSRTDSESCLAFLAIYSGVNALPSFPDRCRRDAESLVSGPVGHAVCDTSELCAVAQGVASSFWDLHFVVATILNMGVPHQQLSLRQA